MTYVSSEGPIALGIMERTFVHLTGIGPKTEESIWAQGVEDWNGFRTRPKVKGISRERKSALDKELETCESLLREGRLDLIVRRFPFSDVWRLYEHLRNGARFIDIETDGLSHNCRLTVLGIARPRAGLQDGLVHISLVRGINLTREVARKALEGASVIVTFNGSSFDLPVIRRELGEDMIPRVPHIDLRYLARKAGLCGGLKVLERRLGIARDPNVQMIVGHDAVRLWSVWERKRHKRALEVLVDYNREDVVNLAPLAAVLFTMLGTRLLARCKGGTIATNIQGF
jgi:uncharacterized protein YprB with RNaseH-like and TPR domain